MGGPQSVQNLGRGVLVRGEEELDQGLWENNICSINVNGLLAKGLNKKNEVEITVKEENIDVLLLQETKLSKDVDSSETYI